MTWPLRALADRDAADLASKASETDFAPLKDRTLRLARELNQSTAKFLATRAV